MAREVLHIGLMEKGGTRVLKLTGELDAYTTNRLAGISKTWILGAKRVIVNLDGLEYIDSAGLAALVSVWVRAREAGAQMMVSCHNPRIRRVLEITGLSNLFTQDVSAVEPKVTDIAFNKMATEMRPNPK